MLFDLGHYRSVLGRLTSAFEAARETAVAAISGGDDDAGVAGPGCTFLHTVAVKANPLIRVLAVAVECGMGLECASLGELELALKGGWAGGRLSGYVCVRPLRE